jgi:sulfhydrogenase subunit beta (sulfur reductase)
MEKIISYENLVKLADGLIGANNIVIGQDEKGIGWKRLTGGNKLIINYSSVPSNLSYKEFLFTKTEPVFYFRNNKENYDLIETGNGIAGNGKIVFIGAKPCDARSIQIMSKVFNWDYKDKFFNQRADKSIVIGVACNYKDEFCFCTSVGLAPASEKGSDVFLIPVDEKKFVVKFISEKGKEFFQPYLNLLTEENISPERILAEIKAPKKKFESAKVKEWITGNFEHKLFDDAGSTCLSCGQCAFACPVCHCFDIVDEECDYTCGRRMKNWDACQFGLFTMHGSGHNPRSTQGKRYRQRVAHKFKYYHDKFEEILCTGCGRCSRGCPAGIDIAKVVTDINTVANQVQE